MALPRPAFIYDELPEQSIRLLEILDAEDDSSKIAFRMKKYRLHDAPAFNALSYVWGQDSSRRQVQCINELNPNGAPIPITPNLWNALPFLKAASKKPIWIDAVCINQDDKNEKSRVVPRMGELYEQAAEVLIWLGPHSEDSRVALALLNWIWFPERQEVLHSALYAYGLTESHLNAICSVVQNNTKITMVNRDIVQLGLPDLSHALWLALPALYRREWLFRVWTFQEAMLAKSATVLCEDSTIPWTAFQQLGETLAETQLLWIKQPSGTFSPIGGFRRLHTNDEGFWWYLRSARDKRCGKQEDRIYGMLGLAPSNIRAQIPVVYKEDPDHYIRVYQSAAAAALLTKTPLETILEDAMSTGKPAAMPSWCPDWTRRKNFNIPVRFSTEARLCNLSSSIIDPLDQNVLRVHGLQTDRIREVIDDYSWYWPERVAGIGGPADRMLQWLNRCAAQTRQTVPPEKCSEAYWQTLFAYSPLCNQYNFPSEPVRGLEAHKRRLAESRDCIPLAETALSSEELKVLGLTLAYLGRLWRGKVFFSTHKGRVGIADKGVASGDALCIFFGASKHYVLHALADGTHSFRSVAYIHGLMGDLAKSLGLYNARGELTEKTQMFRVR